jgi:hypothetical protein
MLPVVEGFISKHPHTKPVVVADAAMLDDERLAELRGKNISYIVGARLANANLGLVQQIHSSLNAVNGASIRLQSKHGDLICDFSQKRYKKELYDLKKLIQKAQELVAKQSSGNKAKFIKRKNRTEHRIDRKKETSVRDKRVLYRFI